MHYIVTPLWLGDSWSEAVLCSQPKHWKLSNAINLIWIFRPGEKFRPIVFQDFFQSFQGKQLLCFFENPFFERSKIWTVKQNLIVSKNCGNWDFLGKNNIVVFLSILLVPSLFYSFNFSECHFPDFLSGQGLWSVEHTSWHNCLLVVPNNFFTRIWLLASLMSGNILASLAGAGIEGGSTPF